MLKIKQIILIVLAFGVGSSTLSAQDNHGDAVKDEIIQVAENLHKALNGGDVDTVGRLLHENVMILEGGHAQKSREEYMSGHMKSDMKFLPFVKSNMKGRKVNVAGDLAWIITHSQTVGEYKGRKIDNPSREMLVLKKGPEGWKITLVHWGSD